MTEQTLAASPLPLADVISANVRILRRRKRWTQEQAGQKWETVTGRAISAQSWYAMERPGSRAWTADDIEAAADLFDVEPVALLVPLDTCAQCNDQPPAGFICATCGVEAPRKA
ncbi:helix-turn-helix domain-containing protein [Streptomyces albidoflavus]|uniref:helix-turn-helix domain-containing protein n=1 Tax=Streptomyces albidoflavus TaxID=1886 RepID=UPI003085363C|nr:helix-turn-helix domain-containing protein [Streptomyces albidoflavus]